MSVTQTNPFASAQVAAPPAQRRADAATEKQIAFAKKLIAERMSTHSHLVDTDLANYSKRMVSNLIDDLLEQPKDKAAATETTAAIELEHGRVYAASDGTPIKVQENQAGTAVYAKVWTGTEWEYAGKAGLSCIVRRLTAEEAAAWGHEHHRCIFCSIKLSDQRSVDAGYGETCAGNYGLPWG